MATAADDHEDNSFAGPKASLDVPEDPALASENVTAAEVRAYFGPWVEDYLSRAFRAVATTRKFGLTGERASAHLAQLGRTRPIGAVGVNFLCGCGISVVDYLVMMFFH